METKKRLVNLDLLKVVSMMMIVCWHYLGHGGIITNATLNDGNYYIAWIIDSLCVVCVNCFVLCSGYLMSENHFKFKKMIELWLQILAVNVVYFVAVCVTKNYDFTLVNIVKCITPITSNAYWYMTVYFIFYALSPLLIWSVNRMTVEQLKKLVIVLVALFAVIPWQWTKISCGYHFVWFIVLFYVAAYIRRADLFKKRVRVYIGAYLIMTLIIFTLNLIITILAKRYESFNEVSVRNYNFIFTFASSVLLFAAFKNMKIKKAKFAGMITFLSSLTLGVYLLHDSDYIRYALWHKYITPLDASNTPYFIPHMIASVLAVFFACAFIEYFRQLLFKLFGVPQLCEKIGAKAQTLADKVFNSDIIEKL